MSRRSRNRAKQHATAKTASSASASRVTRMARVQATYEVWADFRALAYPRPISQVLGDLVTREVDRYRSQQLRDDKLRSSVLVDALERARSQRADLAVIVERLEALQAEQASRRDHPGHPR